MLSPSIQDYFGPVGPVGTLSPSIQDTVGPPGPSGMLSRLFRTMLACWAQMGNCPHLTLTLLAWLSPSVPLIRDSRNVVDMEATGYEYPTAPAGCDGHAVVAMVGFHTDRTTEEAPMDCDTNGPGWDIRDEFRWCACVLWW